MGFSSGLAGFCSSLHASSALEGLSLILYPYDASFAVAVLLARVVVSSSLPSDDDVSGGDGCGGGLYDFLVGGG